MAFLSHGSALPSPAVYLSVATDAPACPQPPIVLMGPRASPKAVPYLKAGTLRASLIISAILGVRARMA